MRVIQLSGINANVKKIKTESNKEIYLAKETHATTNNIPFEGTVSGFKVKLRRILLGLVKMIDEPTYVPAKKVLSQDEINLLKKYGFTRDVRDKNIRVKVINGIKSLVDVKTKNILAEMSEISPSGGFLEIHQNKIRTRVDYDQELEPSIISRYKGGSQLNFVNYGDNNKIIEVYVYSPQGKKYYRRENSKLVEIKNSSLA